jgi:O-antigen/teichoic acid export membrane protein
MSVKRRLGLAFASNSFAYFVTLIVQILSVPVLLHTWGGALYGEWLIASTIPGYLMMSDLGLTSALANDMAMSEARSDRRECVRSFQSIGFAIFAIGLILICVAALAGWLFPLQLLIGTKILIGRKLGELIALLVVQVWLSQCLGVLTAGFRCVGQYALGNFYINCIRLLEYVALWTFALIGYDVILCAGAMTLVLMAGTIICASLLRIKVPWLKLGLGEIQLKPVKRLLTVGLPFMAIPLSFALNLQTPILILGLIAGSEAVVVFSTCRTISRAVFQLFSIMNNSFWPEMTRAYAEGNFEVLRRLFRITVTGSIWFGVAGAVALAIGGPYLYALWTSHILVFDPVLLDILLLVMVANVAWSPASIVLAATNKMLGLASWFLGTNLALVPVCWALTELAGTRGAAISLLVAELCIAFHVLPSSSRLVRDDPRRLVKCLVNPKEFMRQLGPNPWQLLPFRRHKRETPPPDEIIQN